MLCLLRYLLFQSSRSNAFSPPRPPEDALSPSWGERPLSYPSAMGGSSPRWEDGAPSPGVEGTTYGSQEGERDEEDVAHLSILRTPPTISVSRAPSLRRRRSDSDASSGSESSSASWSRTEADRLSKDFDAKSFRFSQYSSKDWDVEVGSGKRYSRDLGALQAGSRKSLARKGSFFSGLRPPSQRPDTSISPLFATLDLPPPPTFVPRVQSPPLDSAQSQSHSQAQLPAPRRRETVGVTAADRKNKVESKYLPSIRHALERKISFGSFAHMARELLPRATNDSQEGVSPANPSISPTSPISPISPTGPGPASPMVKVRTKKLPTPTRPVPTVPAATKTLSINTRKANDVKSQDVKSPGLNVTSPKPSDVTFQPIFQSLAFPSISPVDPSPLMPLVTTKQGHALRHKGKLKLDAPVQSPQKAQVPAVDNFQQKRLEPIAGIPQEAENAATTAQSMKEKDEAERLQRLREEIEATQRAEVEARIKAEVEAKIRAEFEERERERERLREEEAVRIATELEAAKQLKEKQEMARLEQEAAKQRLVAQLEAEAKEEHERARLEEDRLRKEQEAREEARLQATRVAELERELLKARRQEEMRREEAERERKKREDEERERVQQEKQLATERAAAEKAAEERRRKEEQEQIERQKHAQEKADLLARLEEEIRERERQVTLQREEAERREKEIQAELERKKVEDVKREAEARERSEEEMRSREAKLVQMAIEHERRRTESVPTPPPPPPPPPPYVPLSLSQPTRLVTKAAVPVSADNGRVGVSIPPPPPPPPPPPYAPNKSAQRPTGILPSSAVQLKPVPRPVASQFPTQGNLSPTPSGATVEPRERRVSLLDRTKTQASIAPVPRPITPTFRARTTSHVRSNTSPAILSLIEKCAAGTNDHSGLFPSGSKALTPTLTGATLTTISVASGTSQGDGVETMPSSPSDTTATLTFVPPTPTQPTNIKANIKQTEVKNHGHDKYDTASPDVAEATTNDILIETPNDSPSTTTGPLEHPPRIGEYSINRVRPASSSLDTPLPETTPPSVTQHRPSTPSFGPAIPPKPASLERRSSQIPRSSSIISLRAIFDKPATPDPTHQAAQVPEMAAGTSPARKAPPQLAPKPKTSIARLSAFFEQQSLAPLRRSSKSDSPPAQKFIASLPTPDPEDHSPTAVTESIPSKATVDPEAVVNLRLSSSNKVLDAVEPVPCPPKVSELLKAMETSQPISTEAVEKIASTPPVKLKPILAPKPVSLVKSFSVARATSGSPDPSHRAISTWTPSPRAQTFILCMYPHHVFFEDLTFP